jgi:hypothetical protein
MHARLILLLADGPERPIANRGAIQAPPASAEADVRKRRRVIVLEVMMVKTFRRCRAYQDLSKSGSFVDFEIQVPSAF